MKPFLRLCCLLLLFSNGALLPLAAQTPPPGTAGPAFAVIDWRTCLALHPLMADFDFAAGRFSRPGLKRNDHKAMGDLYSAMSQKKKAVEPRRLDLERQRNALQLQLNNLDLQQTQSILRLASGSQGTPRAPLPPEKVESRRRELGDKLAEVVRQNDGLNDQIWNDLFLSAEETDRRLQQIIAEVDGALKETALQYRVTAVIDDTLMAASMPSDIVRDVPESTPLWTNSVYRMILDSPFPEPGKPSMANHWAAELQKNLERQVAAYLATRPDLGPLAGGFRAPRLFVMGGTDLTLPVCERIFARYRLNPYLIQALRKGILSFRR